MSQTRAQLVGGVGFSTADSLTVHNGLAVTGVVTATSFSGSGAGLVGLANTDFINAEQVNVVGVVTATTFNGNLTGNVTGNVTGNATNLTGIPGIRVGIITATSAALTDNISAASGTFTGNVTVGGTLTYDDVTNVDSIGVVTARTGVQFGLAGVGGSVSGTGNANFAGIVTATSLDASIAFWTLGASGTDHYTFTGPGDLSGDTDPDLQLIRGQKYIFKNRSGGHPFRIQSTPNGSAGTQYSDGVTNNDAGNGTDLIFDVPFDAPSILYYQCTSHANMGGSIYIGSSSGDDVNVGAAVTIYASSGIVSATSYFGSGANLTGIDAAPSITATASGAIGIGTAVSVNTDGTVSKVSGGSASESIGSNTTYETGNVSNNQRTQSIAYDTTNNKAIVAFVDTSDSNKGKVVICDISGTTITVGTAVEFHSGATNDVAVAFDQNAGKFVVVYHDTSNGSGHAIVGTYSGTNSATFGSEVNTNGGNGARFNAIVYDENAQKMVIFYQDQADNNSGKAKVGTVSGTSISFGSATEYTGYINDVQHAAYHQVQNKVVLAFVDANDSDKPKGIAGNVSGTSITFGSKATLFGSACNFSINVAYHVEQDTMIFIFSRDSPTQGGIIPGTVSGTTLTVTSGTDVQYDSQPGTTQTGLTYDVAAKKIVVAYNDAQGYSGGKFRAIDFDGTKSYPNQFTIGDETTFKSGNTDLIQAVYDPDEEKVLIISADGDASNRGKIVAIQVAYSHSTSASFIGFSRAAYTNGQTATIDVVGSVNESQTGLSVGKMHYVQQDGSLGITTAIPIVSAGVGLSTTRILVQPALQI